MNAAEYPNTTNMIFTLANAVGVLNCMNTNGTVLNAGFEALEADGVLTEDVRLLEQWLGTLSQDQVITLVDGEEEEMAALMAESPASATGANVAMLVDDIYEALMEVD
jgi:hypothetical protein